MVQCDGLVQGNWYAFSVCVRGGGVRGAQELNKTIPGGSDTVTLDSASIRKFPRLHGHRGAAEPDLGFRD